MKIIDTHQHLWDLNQFSYSWCKTIPVLNRSFLIRDYIDATSELDIDKTVHVEADVDEPFMLQETRHVLALADRDDNPICGVVAAARPEHSGFKDYLDQIAGNQRLKGIRRILHTQPDEIGKSDQFIRNVGALADYGLSFDICVRADQLPIAINLVRANPKVSFILDHCGVPSIKEGEIDPWRGYIKEISGLPNVACKVSGIVVYSDHENWTRDDLHPFVDHVIDCFGWDRVMFGSDWPVCTQAASLKRWVDALLLLTENADDSSRRKLFHDNAERIYRLS